MTNLKSYNYHLLNFCEETKKREISRIGKRIQDILSLEDNHQSFISNLVGNIAVRANDKIGSQSPDKAGAQCVGDYNAKL